MKDIKSALLLFVIFTLLCGGVYPVLVTGVAQTLFPSQAKGSFITDNYGKELGSILICQPFSAPQYFWSRPSATSGYSNNPLASGGSNAGPTNPDYLKTVSERVKMLRATGITGKIPADLVQASASGLDPHILLESAFVQVPRVAKARGLSENQLRKLIMKRVEDRQLGFLGVLRVNVLVLNLELDKL